mmetsp:Transcript_1159/g.2753  ORF Transcript_1159/g.2753 Transcript_1159/m.2753 type:complete len:181 (+) Transcript_1159:224-766(+)
MGPFDASAVVATYAGTAGQDGDTFDPSGKYSVKKQGAFACVECAVSHGDEVMSEGGSMVSMSNNINLKVKLHGGLGASCFRCCCAGESAFFSYYSLQPGAGDRGDIMLAPAVPGEIVMLHLQGNMEWFVNFDLCLVLFSCACNICDAATTGLGTSWSFPFLAGAYKREASSAPTPLWTLG